MTYSKTWTSNIRLCFEWQCCFAHMERIPVVANNVGAFRSPPELPPTLLWGDCVNTNYSASHHHQTVIYNAVWSPSDTATLHLLYLLLNIVSFFKTTSLPIFLRDCCITSRAVSRPPKILLVMPPLWIIHLNIALSRAHLCNTNTNPDGLNAVYGVWCG